MEKTSFSVLFYIRKTKLNRQGEAHLSLRIGKRRKVSLYASFQQKTAIG